MQRELTYRLPFERLRKLSRAASRKAYPTLWWLTWLLLALVFAAIMAIMAYADTLDRLLLRVGTPFGALVLLVATGLVFLVGVYCLRRSRIAQVRERATFNATIRLAQDDGGLRFATEEIEYYLKWRGISQILLDHDGIIVSHGTFSIRFFLASHSCGWWWSPPSQRTSFSGSRSVVGPGWPLRIWLALALVSR